MLRLAHRINIAVDVLPIIIEFVPTEGAKAAILICPLKAVLVEAPPMKTPVVETPPSPV
jgi:hypothetical protein